MVKVIPHSRLSLTMRNRQLPFTKNRPANPIRLRPKPADRGIITKRVHIAGADHVGGRERAGKAFCLTHAAIRHLWTLRLGHIRQASVEVAVCSATFRNRYSSINRVAGSGFSLTKLLACSTNAAAPQAADGRNDSAARTNWWRRTSASSALKPAMNAADDAAIDGTARAEYDRAMAALPLRRPCPKSPANPLLGSRGVSSWQGGAAS